MVVVRGRYRYSPRPGRSENQVDLYGKRLLPDGDDLASGAGTFPAFLERVGQWIHRPVVNEVEGPPPERICWFNHGSEVTRPEDHDESLMLQHLREQTGLTFTRERRRIRVLFIERRNDCGGNDQESQGHSWQTRLDASTRKPGTVPMC